MTKIFLTLFLSGIIALLSAFEGAAQVFDSAQLAGLPVYNSIQEALLLPDSVYKLNLKKKKLEKFPEEIFQFKNLRELDISKNKITEVPRKIGTLSNLVVLNISKNKLQTLPAEIGQLKQLKKLIISQNDITYLPPEIGNAESIEYIDMWSNELISLPDEMRQLKKLRILDLRVIEFNDERQKEFKNLLPHTKIYFSNPCNCGG